MDTEKNPKLTIGNVARLSNVGVETVRFYERKGIIKQPPKLTGRRSYPEEAVQKIRFVKKMQELGFGLDEIKEFLHLTECSGSTAEIVKKKTEKKMEEIQAKINDLNAVLSTLDKFAGCCGSETVEHNCELLKCFENDWNCCQ